MSIDNYIVNNRIKCNVYGSNGELLIGVGTPINNRIKKHLNERKWFVDKPAISIYENISFLDEDFMPIINNDINTKKLFEKAKKIVDLILNNPVIFSNLKKINEYDKYTYEHCNQVAYLSVAMAIKLELSKHSLINVAIASLTHDIGKCMVDEKIINKPGKLTKEEMDVVRKHSEYGYYMMKEYSDIDQDVLNAILFHHENYDGTGYPLGLKHDKIPIEASILHICDVFDALISERPYKKKLMNTIVLI